MATKKKLEGTLGNFDGTLQSVEGLKKASEKKKKQAEQIKPFKKPTADFYKIDLIVRDTVETQTEYKVKGGKKVTRPIKVQTKEIKMNYKAYLERRAREEHTSITKYIHKLIDEDMQRNS